MPSKRIITVDKAMRERMMTTAMQWLVRFFGNKTGIMLFTFDFGTGRNFLSYKSNANRDDALTVLREWDRINKMEPGTEAPPIS